MTSDFEEMLRALESFDVRYLVVGGHALMLYTDPRHTKDLDIWVEASEENANRVYKALAAFGAPLAGASPADFAEKGVGYQLGVPPVRVDILTSIDGVDFTDAWPRRVESHLGNQRAWFISKKDLIQNKRASGRHIDLHDVESLEGGQNRNRRA